MKITNERLLLLAVAILGVALILTMMTLSESWANERFLDAELRKHTTTTTNKIK